MGKRFWYDTAMIAALFAVTAFLGSFLLFLVQPMVGKWLLPTFGGAPAVWTVSLVFFQGALLGGYLLTHLSLGRLSSRIQPWVHLILLGFGAAFLPPLRDGLPGLAGPDSPVRGVFLVLSLAVGWTFLMLAAGSPVLQAWYARLERAGLVRGEPWGLYAAGNAGSLLALLGYPFFIESTWSLSRQSHIWSGGYLLLIILFAGCAWFTCRAAPATSGIAANEPGERRSNDGDVLPTYPKNGARTAPDGTISEEPIAPAPPQRLRWLVLAAIPSALLNSLTGFITTDLAPLPLLWVVPLALYLLSFVIVFSPAGNRLAHLPGALVALVFLPLPLTTESTLHWPLLLSAGHHLLLCMAIFLLFHGQLYRERPEASHLSGFYLWMSLGGLIGGMSSSLIAPLVFSSCVDYPLLLLIAAGFTTALGLADTSGTRFESGWNRLFAGLVIVLATGALFWRFVKLTLATPVSALLPAVLGPFLILFGGKRLQDWVPSLCALWMLVNTVTGSVLGTTLAVDRNFFGAVRIAAMRGDEAHVLLHGNICHGSQGWTDELRRLPLSYYAPSSSIHQLLSWMQFRRKSLRIGIVGLGTGALAGYARPADDLTFYEIDPKIVTIARNPAYFTFLQDCRGKLTIVEADGRLGIRREADESFDLLIFDAYSSNAIPTHLLTKEAVSEYLTKLKPGGILVFHLSNQFLKLRPVLGNIVTVLGLEGWSCHDEPDLFPDHHLTDLRRFLTYGAIWAAASRPGHPIRALFDDLAWKRLSFHPELPLWTDEHTPINHIYTWR